MKVDNTKDDDMIVVTMSREEAESIWEVAHMAQFLFVAGAINRKTFDVSRLLRDRLNVFAAITEIH